MPPDALHCFYELAERQNYLDAAQVLGIRPKTLSDTVKTLEQQLGVSLLAAQRGVRTVQLTRAGETLKALSPKFFAEQARLHEQVQAAGQRLLRVALSGGGALLEAELLTRLRRSTSQPESGFTLVRALLPRQRAGIQQGEFDAGLSQAAQSNEDQGLAVEVAWREPLVALLPHTHLLTLHEKLYPSRLADYRLIVADARVDDYGSQIDHLLHAYGISNASSRQDKATPNEVILAALGNQGVGLLGATQWAHGNQLVHLTALPVVDEQTHEPLWLTTYLRRPSTVNPILAESMAAFKARLAREGLNPSISTLNATSNAPLHSSLSEFTPASLAVDARSFD